MVRVLLVLLSLVYLISAQQPLRNRQGFGQQQVRPRQSFPVQNRGFQNRQGFSQHNVRPSNRQGFGHQRVRPRNGFPTHRGGFRKQIIRPQDEGLINTAPNQVVQQSNLLPAAAPPPAAAPLPAITLPVGPPPAVPPPAVPFFPTLDIPFFDLPGCVLNGKSYQQGETNSDSCLVMRCNFGVWEYTNITNAGCGNCTVEGDPHFLTFDHTSFRKPIDNKYQFGGTGNFVITQDGSTAPNSSPFGLNAVFGRCNTDHSPILSCVTSISYYEPGITVEVELPPQKTMTTFPACTRAGHNPIHDLNCQFKVKVNEIEREIPTDSTVAESATSGDVLIFTANGIDRGAPGDLFCMNIVGSSVGSKGLSVSLCQHKENFSYLHVFAMPTLKSFRSQLYGLCNTYTGEIQHGFTTPGLLGTGETTSETSFGDSWRIPDSRVISPVALRRRFNRRRFNGK